MNKDAENLALAIANKTTTRYENLEWTTTPPTVPGWYWVRKHNGDIDIDNVYECKGMFFIADGYFGDLDLAVTKASYTHWLGPLPIPELPKV